MTEWQMQEAKARFSEVLKKAASEGPQRITVHGKPAAVLISEAQFRRLVRPKPHFIKFMRKSPFIGVQLDLDRDRSLTRETDIE